MTFACAQCGREILNTDVLIRVRISRKIYAENEKLDFHDVCLLDWAQVMYGRISA